MSETSTPAALPATIAPALLSAERLAEMQELHEAWLTYRSANPDYPTTKESVFLELVRGHRYELLAHAAALEVKTPAPLIGDSAALFAHVRHKYQAELPFSNKTEAANWFRLSEVLDHAEAALTANERMREEILQGQACCEQLRHELAAYLTPTSRMAEAAGVPAPLTEREREPYLAAIEHGKPALGDWHYPRMLKRLLAAYDAQAATLENASYMTATAEMVALRQQLATAQARIKEQQSELAEQERAKLLLIQETHRWSAAVKTLEAERVTKLDQEV